MIEITNGHAKLSLNYVDHLARVVIVISDDEGEKHILVSYKDLVQAIMKI